MSKPGADPSSGISLGDALRLPKRHPACRRREAQSGSCMERENLAGDVKGKGASGSNREAESTDAPERGGLPCSSAEAGVMLVERRGQVIAVGSEPTGNRRSSNSRRKAAAFVRWHEPDDARVSSRDLWGARGAIGFWRGSPVTRLPMTQKTIAKPNIAAAIAKLMCLRMTKPPNGR